jgi:hypothetical protein
LGGFAQIPLGVLAAVYGLVLVCIELFLNTVALELSVATLTDAKNGQAVVRITILSWRFGNLQSSASGGRA